MRNEIKIDDGLESHLQVILYGINTGLGTFFIGSPGWRATDTDCTESYTCSLNNQSTLGHHQPWNTTDRRIRTIR